MARFYQVVASTIDDTQLYRKGHAVERWRSTVLEEIELAIWQAAPYNKRNNKSRHPATFGGPTNPGWLKASIFSEKQTFGSRNIAGTVTVGAGYALAVIKGTKGGTKNTRPGERRTRGGQFAGTANTRLAKGRAYQIPFYNIPSNPGFGYGWKKRFKGQKANNFPVRGWNRVAAKHRGVPRLRD